MPWILLQLLLDFRRVFFCHDIIPTVTLPSLYICPFNILLLFFLLLLMFSLFQFHYRLLLTVFEQWLCSYLMYHETVTGWPGCIFTLGSLPVLWFTVSSLHTDNCLDFLVCYIFLVVTGSGSIILCCNDMKSISLFKCSLYDNIHALFLRSSHLS